MVILSSQRMQRLAAKLQQVEQGVERAGGEVEDAMDEARGEGRVRPGPAVEDELGEIAARAGVELSTARRMDGATLSRTLSRGPGGGGGRLWTAAEVLFVDGLAARARGEERVARSRWEKAAYLYRQLDEAVDLPEEAVPPGDRLQRIGDWTEPG